MSLITALVITNAILVAALTYVVTRAKVWQWVDFRQVYGRILARIQRNRARKQYLIEKRTHEHINPHTYRGVRGQPGFEDHAHWEPKGGGNSFLATHMPHGGVVQFHHYTERGGTTSEDRTVEPDSYIIHDPDGRTSVIDGEMFRASYEEAMIAEVVRKFVGTQAKKSSLVTRTRYSEDPQMPEAELDKLADEYELR